MCAKQTLEIFYIDRVLNTGSYFKMVFINTFPCIQQGATEIPLRNSRNGIENSL